MSYANFGKLRLKTEAEQQLWNECCRLITNCIIYYNASILSRLLAHKEAAGDRAGAEVLTQVSPIAWQHMGGVAHAGLASGLAAHQLLRSV